MELTFSELRELVAALNQTDISELTLKSAAFELTLRKPNAAPAAVGMAPAAAPPPPVSASTTASPSPSPATEAPSVPPPIAADSNLVDITSPMVGTFYRAPAPDEPPFVHVGDRIQNGQTVCIIEAMKLMNELEAETTGEVVEILVENGQPVEFGQPLMRLRPDKA